METSAKPGPDGYNPSGPIYGVLNTRDKGKNSPLV
jgi:hypothetical protein